MTSPVTANVLEFFCGGSLFHIRLSLFDDKIFLLTVCHRTRLHSCHPAAFGARPSDQFLYSYHVIVVRRVFLRRLGRVEAGVLIKRSQIKIREKNSVLGNED